MADISEILIDLLGKCVVNEGFKVPPQVDIAQTKAQIQQFYLGLLPEKDMDGPDAGEFEKGQANGFNNAVDLMAKNIREKS